MALLLRTPNSPADITYRMAYIERFQSAVKHQIDATGDGQSGHGYIELYGSPATAIR
jgi:hypothetical protein